MIAIKGKYDGTRVTLDGSPVTHECEVIITFLDPPDIIKTIDDGSLAYLFKDYIDDGIRESVIDYGDAVGSEQW
jgi:hypothetical protein